ncbi:MAG: universal stress protein [Pseudolabrys sp.]|nr:universal stress protein [Pseudolabrys sp.]
MTKVLACIDGSVYSHSVCDHAAWAAVRMKASVDLLHVVGRRDLATAPMDLSGSIPADAQQHLLEELATLDAARAKLTQKRGRMMLDEAKARITAAGVADVTVYLRHGDLLETLTERQEKSEGQADGQAGLKADLIVIGKRGEAADFAKLHLGSNLERVVRATRQPILVAARAFKPIKRLLIAFDGGPSSRKAVETVAGSPQFAGLECHLVMAGPDTEANRAKVEQAALTLTAAGLTAAASVEAGPSPEAVIAAKVEALSIDLLVMGAYGHSRIRSLVIGSTTTEMVRSCKIPIYLMR